MKPGAVSIKTRAVLLSVALTVALTGLAVPAARGATAGTVVSRHVTFHVKATNTSRLPCPSDSGSYDVSGHVVGPADRVDAAGGAATLYLHGFGHGEWLWDFGDVPGYNYGVELGNLGQVSVIVDRLGYGASGHPVGTQSCLGAQADVAHQIVQILRAGRYDEEGAAPVAYKRIALAGLSAGGLITQAEAYSFRDIDAMVVMAYADQGASQPTFQTLAVQGQKCASGGEPAGPGQPSGYAYFGETANDFKALMFHDADPTVQDAASSLRNRDPCGDIGSLPQAVSVDQAMIGSIDVPILVVCGRNDAIFPPPACQQQTGHYSGSKDVTGLFLDDTGHALPLEKSAPAFRSGVANWLHSHGF